MKKYDLKFKPVITDQKIFTIKDNHIYYKNICISKGSCLNEITFKGYFFSDYIYEYDLFTINFSKNPVLYSHPNNFNKEICHSHELYEALLKNKTKCYNKIDSRNILFKLFNIKVTNIPVNNKILFYDRIIINSIDHFQCVTEYGLSIISNKYSYFFEENNIVGIDFENNRYFIYDDGIKIKYLSLLKSIINLFTENYSGLEYLFSQLYLHEREYFWKYLPKNTNLICHLYRQTDLKIELLNFIGNFYDANAESLSKIIIFFPELQENFVKMSIKEKKEYLIEDYVKYLQKNNENTENLEDLLLSYNCFYLYLLCKPEDYELFTKWKSLIELEKLYIDTSRIKNNRKE